MGTGRLPSDPRDLPPAALEQWLAARGLPLYRAAQVMDWLYKRPVHDFSAMKTLPEALRSELAREFTLQPLHELARRTSQDGTVKYAFLLDGGAVIESVWMPEARRATLCLSSQAGCRMACGFCRTGQGGFSRHLRPSEIVGQLLAVRARHPVTNLVFMGMGEPLDNLENVLDALAILCESRALAFPPRKITLSTIGLAPGLEALAGRAPAVKLAVSLHSAVPSTRERLMPAARDSSASSRNHSRPGGAGALTRAYTRSRALSLPELKQALKKFPLPPRGRITLEMVLLGGVNDSLAEARALVRWLSGLAAKVNLIPFNECPGSGFRAPAEDAVLAFQKVLKEKGVPAFIRLSRGRDISAACGQLRGEIFETGEKNCRR
jgi:23S rRNA (adenine2503-C2)-methyltransferase